MYTPNVHLASNADGKSTVGLFDFAEPFPKSLSIDNSCRVDAVILSTEHG